MIFLIFQAGISWEMPGRPPGRQVSTTVRRPQRQPTQRDCHLRAGGENLYRFRPSRTAQTTLQTKMSGADGHTAVDHRWLSTGQAPLMHKAAGGASTRARVGVGALQPPTASHLRDWLPIHNRITEGSRPSPRLPARSRDACILFSEESLPRIMREATRPPSLLGDATDWCSGYGRRLVH